MTVQAMETDDFLEHFGVKGMKWGIRKEQESGSERTGTEAEAHAVRVKRAKQIAIGTGVLVGVAGAAYLAYSLSQNRNVSVDDIADSVASIGKKASEKIVSEPTDIIHLARGKEAGMRFLRKGGIPDALLSEFDKVDLNARQDRSFFERYGDRAEKIAARMDDPSGRKDRAGRPIFHDIVIPESMTKGIESLKDVEEKIWPLLKDDYQALYDEKKI